VQPTEAEPEAVAQLVEAEPEAVAQPVEAEPEAAVQPTEAALEVAEQPVGAEPEAVAQPVEAEPEAVARPVEAEPRQSLRPKDLSARPAYVWNPLGLSVDGIPDALGPVSTKPFKAQFVPEYVTGVPAYLDETWQGDVGFDPWALVALADPASPEVVQGLLSAEARKARLQAMSVEEQAAAVEWMRESELKHGRLAMLAAAGWPLAELLQGPAGALRATGGRAPSLFNGQLLENWPFLLAFAGGLAYLETQVPRAKGGDYGYGDYFHPLGEEFQLAPLEKLEWAEKEVKNGRLAMMAITGMAVQEFLSGKPVIEQTPWFFGR